MLTAYPKGAARCSVEKKYIAPRDIREQDARDKLFIFFLTDRKNPNRVWIFSHLF